MKYLDAVDVSVINPKDKYDVWSCCGHFHLGEIRKTLDGYRFYPEQFQNLESNEMRGIALTMEILKEDK